MNRVTLYTTNRKLVNTYGDGIPVTTFEPMVRCWNSPDTFIKSEISVDHLPVKMFCFTQENGDVENRFVAFDRELEEIIQVMLDDYTRELQNRHRQAIDVVAEAHNDYIKHLKSRTIWDMIKLKFNKLLK